jgi:hypothetical protein
MLQISILEGMNLSVNVIPSPMADLLTYPRLFLQNHGTIAYEGKDTAKRNLGTSIQQMHPWTLVHAGGGSLNLWNDSISEVMSSASDQMLQMDSRHRSNAQSVQ